MDYYHQKGKQNISILGIKGRTMEDSYIFNSILSNDTLLDERFGKGKPILIVKIHKIRNKDVTKIINNLKLPIIPSTHNILSNKKSKNKSGQSRYIITKSTVLKINNILKDLGNLSIGVGKYGKGTIQIYDKKILKEQNLKLDTSYDTPEKIAEYINNHY